MDSKEVEATQSVGNQSSNNEERVAPLPVESRRWRTLANKLKDTYKRLQYTIRKNQCNHIQHAKFIILRGSLITYIVVFLVRYVGALPFDICSTYIVYVPPYLSY